MGEAPVEHRVSQITADGKVVVEGFGQALDVLPKDVQVAVGQTVKGWLNPTGKYGPYLKIAEDRQRSNGSGSNNEGQIVGWAHTLAAFELAHNLQHETVADRAREILAHRNASARAEATPSSPADQGSANGADTPAQSSEGLSGNPPF